jgi:hypothetical protein
MALKIKNEQGNVEKIPNMAEVNSRINSKLNTYTPPTPTLESVIDAGNNIRNNQTISLGTGAPYPAGKLNRNSLEFYQQSNIGGAFLGQWTKINDDGIDMLYDGINSDSTGTDQTEIQIDGTTYGQQIRIKRVSSGKTVSLGTNGLNSSTNELSINNTRLTDVLDPTNNQDAATKYYVDNQISSNTIAIIDGLTSTITTAALSANQGRILNDNKLDKVTGTTTAMQAYVKYANGSQGMNFATAQADADAIAIRTTLGNLRVPLIPTDDSYAASKQYVDNLVSSAAISLQNVLDEGNTADYKDGVADFKLLDNSYDNTSNPNNNWMELYVDPYVMRFKGTKDTSSADTRDFITKYGYDGISFSATATRGEILPGWSWVSAPNWALQQDLWISDVPLTIGDINIDPSLGIKDDGLKVLSANPDVSRDLTSTERTTMLNRLGITNTGIPTLEQVLQAGDTAVHNNGIRIDNNADFNDPNWGMSMITPHGFNQTKAGLNQSNMIMREGFIDLSKTNIGTTYTLSMNPINGYKDDSFKVLSGNPDTSRDLTSTERTTMRSRLDIVIIDNLTTTSTTGSLSANQGKILQDNKVDKISGKDLSTNDFTNDYKAKLDWIGAQTLSDITAMNITNQIVHVTSSGAKTLGISSVALQNAAFTIVYTSTNAATITMPSGTAYVVMGDGSYTLAANEIIEFQGFYSTIDSKYHLAALTKA